MEDRRSPSPLPHLLPLLSHKVSRTTEDRTRERKSTLRFPEPPHQNVRSQQQDEGAFQLVKGRKKGRSPTPPKDTATSLKKRKTTEVETSNQYDALPTPMAKKRGRDRSARSPQHRSTPSTHHHRQRETAKSAP
ncbi:hypothetical protein TNCV_4518721 [Trichonephila clavipes]|nr:hypothetical protein TNCV_4518721 [Trichonephila clavipes]